MYDNRFEANSSRSRATSFHSLMNLSVVTLILVTAVLLTSCQLNSQLNMESEADEGPQEVNEPHKVKFMTVGGNTYFYGEKELNDLGFYGIKKDIAETMSSSSENFIPSICISIAAHESLIDSDEAFKKLIEDKEDKIEVCNIVVNSVDSLDPEAVITELKAGRLSLRQLESAGSSKEDGGLLNNKAIVLEGVTGFHGDPSGLQYASDLLLSNREFIMQCMKAKPKSWLSILEYAEESMKNDINFFTEITLSNIPMCSNLYFEIFPSAVVSEELKKDPEFVLDILYNYMDRCRNAHLVQLLPSNSEGLSNGLKGGRDPESDPRPPLSAIEISYLMAGFLDILKGMTLDMQEAICAMHKEELLDILEDYCDEQCNQKLDEFFEDGIFYFIENLLLRESLVQKEDLAKERDVVLSFPGLLKHASNDTRNDKEFMRKFRVTHGSLDDYFHSPGCWVPWKVR